MHRGEKGMKPKKNSEIREKERSRVRRRHRRGVRGGGNEKRKQKRWLCGEIRSAETREWKSKEGGKEATAMENKDEEHYKEK